MKKLTLLTLAALFTANSAFAHTDIFNPDPSTSLAGGPPLTETLGTPYTQVVNGGATIAYSPNSFTVTDGTNNGGQAYITSTENLPNLNQVYTHLVFTPTYTATDATGQRQGQSNTSIFELEPSSGSNNDALNVVFQTSGFNNNQANILLESGIAYGGASVTGTNSYSSKPINGLSGVTLTLDLKTVFVTDPTGLSTITTTGTLTSASGLLQTFDYVTSESDVTTGYDPANNFGGGGLTYRTGLDSTGADTGFLTGPLSIKISADEVFVPEPSTYALLAGGLLFLGWMARRKLTV